MNRDDYIYGTVDHHTFYCAVVDAIGRKEIEDIVKKIAPIEDIREALKTDGHLLSIPLWKWDRYHGAVLSLVEHRGPAVMAVSWSARSELAPRTVYWSLSETVSTLKAAARRMATET